MVLEKRETCGWKMAMAAVGRGRVLACIREEGGRQAGRTGRGLEAA